MTSFFLYYHRQHLLRSNHYLTQFYSVSQPIIYFHISKKHSKPEIKGPTKGVSQAHLALFLTSDLNWGQDNGGTGGVWRGILSAESRAELGVFSEKCIWDYFEQQVSYAAAFLSQAHRFCHAGPVTWMMV